LFHLHDDNIDHFFYTSTSYNQPLALDALISHQDFNPELIDAIITRVLNDNIKHIVLDTGCTFAFSPDRTDFIEYHTIQDMSMIQKVGGQTKILGHGMVQFTLVMVVEISFLYKFLVNTFPQPR
jgi:hypothetical protein